MMLFFIHVCFFYVGCCAFQGYFFHATGTLSSTLGTFHCFTFPSTTSATSLNGRFLPYVLSPHFCHNLLLSKPPKEPEVVL